MTFEFTGIAGANLRRVKEAEGLQVCLIGATVVFAALGLGETVYRLLFLDFDGVKDRLPIEAFFGILFGYLAAKLVRSVYRRRKQRKATLHWIWDRNHRIRYAAEAISPVAHPLRNQQSLRVIREELEKIESALKDVLPS
jgi:hypothetical protein